MLLAAMGLFAFGVREASAQAAPIVFSVIGDVPYGVSELPDLQQHVADHNLYSPSRFLVHLGDMLFGECLEARYAEVHDVLRELAVPAFIVPGDNEWNDCDDPDQGWEYWETYFLGLEQNYCGTPAVERQGVRPENFAFVSSGVLFLGINLVGGSVHDEDEWDLRLQQDANWVGSQLTAKKSQVRSAVIFAQAGPGSSSRALFFNQFDPAAASFAKPILFIHGDGHSWRQDRPFLSQNVLRVQVSRGTDPPVQVTATTDALNPFLFERDPFDDLDPINQPPCVTAGPNLTIDLLESASLAGRTSDDQDPPPFFETSWSRVSGPGSVSFEEPAAPMTSASFTDAGVYRLRLSADDGDLVSSDDVDVTVLSDEPRFTIDDVFVDEADDAVFTVTLAGANGTSTRVNYATAPGTATAPADYTSTSGTLFFSGSTTTRTISVPVVQDALQEPSESFFVNLSSPVDATLFKSQGAAVILDDDTIYYPLDVNVEGPGSVVLDPPGGLYADGTVVTLTAQPSLVSSLFRGWSGDLAGAATSVPLVMSAARSVTATFEDVPGLGASYRQVATGSASLSNLVSTSTPLAAVQGQLYLAAVSTNPHVDVTEVSGLGLSWTLVASQCSGRNRTGVSLWKARGTPSGDGPVAATLSSSPDNAVVAVTRYAGVPDGDEVGNLVTANSNGFAGACEDGDDDDEYALPLTTLDTGSIVVAAAAMRQRTHTPGSGWTERIEVRLGSSNPTASVAVQERAFGFPGTVGVEGEFSSDADYAVVAAEIRRALVAPQTYSLTLQTSGGGSVTPASGPRDAGAVIALTATPAEGFAFTGWSGDLTGAANPTTILLDRDQSITAHFTPLYALTLATAGGGVVAANPPDAVHLAGTTVALTATPDPGWAFTGWSGDLDGLANPTSVVMDAHKTVTAGFTRLHELTVTSSAGGHVEPTPAGSPYLEGSVVSLLAVPDPGFAFTGWDGDLVGSANPASIAMDGPRSVSASFLPLYDLGVATSGAGSVSLDPSGGTYLVGTLVGLVATPDPGWAFVGWSGDLTGTANPASLAMDAHKSVTASFLPLYDLAIQVAGGGTVSPAPPTGPYVSGTLVTLTATPASGFAFTGWSGDLGGAENPVTITMTGHKSVTASFTPLYDLNLSVSGEGQVALSPPSGPYVAGTTVTLTATPSPNHVFTGWSGALSGTTNPATLTMNGTRNVTATFLPLYALNLTVSGQGQVALSPPSGPYVAGTTVTLTATPSPNHVFTGWSGALSGTTNPATLTMNDTRNVTATFLPLYAVNLTVSGQGQVALSPPSGPYVAGSVVTLTATPAPGFAFAGWSGSVQGGTNPISVTVNGPKQVTATFTALHRLTLTASGEGSATASPPGPSYLEGTVVTVAATANAGSSFTGWSGALSGKTTPTTLVMDGPKTVTASFAPYYPLTLAVNGEGAVETSPAGGSHLRGTVVTLTATPSPGWTFTSWSGAVSGTTNPRTITMDGPRTVTANFTRLASLTVLPSTGGSVVASPAGGSYFPGTVVSLTAAASPGFAFTGWSGALSGASNPASLVLTGNASVTASFAPLYALVAGASGGGHVSVEPPEGSYPAGTVVSLTATADPGWDFDGWSGDVSGTANPSALTMDDDKQVTAVFAAPEPSQALLLTGALGLVRWLARAPGPSRRRRSPGTRGAPARTT